MLVRNRFAYVSDPVPQGDDWLIQITAPKPHSWLHFTCVSLARDPALYRAIAHLARENRKPDGPERARLRTLGLLVERHAVPMWRRFSCPLMLHPSSGFALRTSSEDASSDLSNRMAGLPYDVRARFERVAYFARRPEIALSDPVTDLVFPYWTSISPPDLRVTNAEAEVCRAIAGAGVVVDRHDLSRTRASWATLVERWSQHLHEHGYTSVAGAIPGSHLTALRRHCRMIADHGFLEWREAERRLVQHNEEISRMYLHLLTPFISALAGRPLKPSYAYTSVYRRGANLPWHVDREACEYTASLLLDWEPRPPESQEPFPWPILVELPKQGTKPQVAAIRQRVGDILVFQGRKLPHHRPRLRAAKRSMHIFFHYVPLEFEGPLD